MLIAHDLFAGAGGWDVAAAQLGITAHGVENMPEARLTRDAAGLSTIHDDVWTFDHLEVGADGLIASPPCQTFSKAGKGSGRKALDQVLALIDRIEDMNLEDLKAEGEALGDDRTALVLTPLLYALAGDYRWLAWEQVPTVLPVWEACATKLREHGWHVWTGTLSAERYGTPQTRQRAVLIAALDWDVHEPVPTHSRYHSRTPSRLDPGVEKWVTMSQALGWPPCERVGFPRRADSADIVTIDGTDYRARDLRSTEEPSLTVTEKARSWMRVHPDGTTSCPCGGPVTLHMPSHDRAYDRSVPRTADQPAPTMAFGNAAAQVRWSPREKTEDGLDRFAQQSDNMPDWHWPDNRPATTVAGRDIVQAPGATANRFNGSTKSRNDGIRVSVAEAGVLQGFPADFPWQGKRTKQFLQAGNAVPVQLARAVLQVAAGLTASTRPW